MRGLHVLYLAGLGVLLLATGVSAQAFFENFEGYSVGAEPSGDWYAFSASDTSGTFSVQNGGNPGKQYEHDTNTDGSYSQFYLDFDACDIPQLDWDQRYNIDQSGSGNAAYYILSADPVTSIANLTNNNMISYRIHPDAGGGALDYFITIRSDTGSEDTDSVSDANANNVWRWMSFQDIDCAGASVNIASQAGYPSGHTLNAGGGITDLRYFTILNFNNGKATGPEIRTDNIVFSVPPVELFPDYTLPVTSLTGMDADVTGSTMILRVDGGENITARNPITLGNLGSQSTGCGVGNLFPRLYAHPQALAWVVCDGSEDGDYIKIGKSNLGAFSYPENCIRSGATYCDARLDGQHVNGYCDAGGSDTCVAGITQNLIGVGDSDFHDITHIVGIQQAPPDYTDYNAASGGPLALDHVNLGFAYAKNDGGDGRVGYLTAIFQSGAISAEYGDGHSVDTLATPTPNNDFCSAFGGSSQYSVIATSGSILGVFESTATGRGTDDYKLTPTLGYTNAGISPLAVSCAGSFVGVADAVTNTVLVVDFETGGVVTVPDSVADGPGSVALADVETCGAYYDGVEERVYLFNYTASSAIRTAYFDFSPTAFVRVDIDQNCNYIWAAGTDEVVVVPIYPVYWGSEDPTNPCFYDCGFTPGPTSTATGTGGAGGGVIGDPVFPGIDFDSIDGIGGISAATWAILLGLLLLAIGVVAGLIYGGPILAVFLGLTGLMLAVLLSLWPVWTISAIVLIGLVGLWLGRR